MNGVPQDVKVILGNQATITLGDTYDKENNKDIKLETFEKNKNTLPSFIFFNDKTKEYTIAPTINDKDKKITIVIRITDSYGA